MIYTFYSYKGGVGRSMALANVAQWFFERGSRVVIIDWDLEAPGLERFFCDDSKTLERIRQRLGVIDLIVSYKQEVPHLTTEIEALLAEKVPINDKDRPPSSTTSASNEEPKSRVLRLFNDRLAPLKENLIEIRSSRASDKSTNGSAGIWLLSAGWRTRERFDDYAQAVQRLDWSEFYSAFYGEYFFEWWRNELEKNADVILVDSRTGITEMGGVCTRQLADVIIACCVPNDQNLTGTMNMLRSFTRNDVKKARESSGYSLPQIVVVPMRIENSENDLLLNFKSDFQEAAREFQDFDIKVEESWQFRIPYVPMYSYKEKLAIGANDANEDLKRAYEILAASLASLALKDPIWTSTKPKSLQSSLTWEAGRVLNQVLHRSGVFISYARSDGEKFADVLRQRLEAERIPLWLDRFGMEGGRDWWLQVKEALDRVEFMALVITPNAMNSDTVRKYWRYARQQGVCVYPIKGTPDLDFDSLPRWVRSMHFYDLGTLQNGLQGPEWRKFINDLNTRCQARRVPFMVEDLPDGFVQRPREFDQLLKLLIDEQSEEPVAITAALRGAGGYGKTTLAKALCHDERIQEAFDDGILWVTLGENPGDLMSRVEDLIVTLSGDRPGFTTHDAAVIRLKELLADRNLLIVLDDVWDRAHLNPFLQGGSRCARLITTRNLDTVPASAAKVQVDAMHQNEATAVLAAGLDQTLFHDGSLSLELNALASRLGEWPLLLRLVNSTLRNRIDNDKQSAHDAIMWINTALSKRGLTYFDVRNSEERSAAVGRTLGISLDMLSAQDRERYGELAIFPEDFEIPLSTLEKLWSKTGGFDEFDTEELCSRLNRFSLLLSYDASRRCIRLHDVVRKFLIEQQREKLTSIHVHLLDAYRPVDSSTSLPRWSEIAAKDPYLLDHLAHHLIGADRGDELVSTVKDWRYLVEKTLVRKALAVEVDLLAAQRIAADDKPLQLIRRNFVNSGHILSRSEKRDDVEVTLFSRLQHLHDLKSLTTDLEQHLKRPCVVPAITLPDLPHPALVRTLSGHASRVKSCAMSVDGATIVSASSDSTIKVWDGRSGAERFTLSGHAHVVNGCAVSADGATIVSASNDQTLKVWDGRNGAGRFTLSGHAAKVNGCAVSADGTTIVSASDDQTVKVWDGRSGAERFTLSGHAAKVNGCAVSTDGAIIVSASDDHTLKVWDGRSGAERFTLSGHAAGVNGCAVSADGAMIVSASGDQTLKVWDGRSGAERFTLRGHASMVIVCAVSADGATIVSASWDHTLRVWDGWSGAERFTLSGHASMVNGCSISADGGMIVSASSDLTLKVWDGRRVGEHFTPSDHVGVVNGCAVSSDGAIIVSAWADHTLKVWDGCSGAERFTLSGHPAGMRGCAVSADGAIIVSASDDKTLKVWDAHSESERFTLSGHTAGVIACAVSADGATIVSASNDHTLKIWDGRSGLERFTLNGHASLVNGCAVSADGATIISASEDHTLKVWDGRSGTERSTLTGHTDGVLNCAVSADGATIVSASWDQVLKVWDGRSGLQHFTLIGHASGVSGCAVSADGLTIVSASWDQTLKVWDRRTGQCLTTLYVDGPLNGCACSADGETIAAAGPRGLYFLRLVR